MPVIPRQFGRLPDHALVSCLCVTEGRSAFMPWLLWCFDRQTWPRRELVIVDSSEHPFGAGARDDIRVVALPPGTGIARKRNLALQAARGDVVAWFDDDDWQHPEKLACHVEALRDGMAYAGSLSAWFVDLAAARCARLNGAQGVTFNSAGFRREAVLPLTFREDVARASDSYWMREVVARHCGSAAVIARDDLFFWLSHEGNVSNPARKRRFSHHLARLRDRIGSVAWGDTDAALDSLRSRLAAARAEKAADGVEGRRVFVGMERTNEKGNEGVRAMPADPPAVGLMIKATVLDTPFLDVMVRHMIAQARYPFAERAIIVDRPQVFAGKYATRPRSSDAELDAVLDVLVKDGVVDHVREVDRGQESVERVTAQYFTGPGQLIPTHASSGGPVYATLFGLESMSTDFIVQMDADVLFHTGPASWVSRGLQCMAADPRLWLMMTHPGPPAGPPGRSIGPDNRLRAIWDPALGIWRFRHATTRYFLCDRRTLRHRLPFVPDVGGCAPLEQCVSKALQQHGAFRGNIGDLQSWHLHVWDHGGPFPAWAASLAKAVETGVYPAVQRGRYDLRLDRPADRAQWERLLASLDNRAGERVPRSAVVRHVRAVEPARGSSPLTVIIPIRDRSGQRLRNMLRSLQWQSAGAPEEVLVVSHGSQPEIDHELEGLCREEGAGLITMSRPSDPWNKSLALNTGIRQSRHETPFLMTMDADMVLAPDFLSIVLERLRRNPPALVLCRISDLPSDACVPVDREPLLASFDRLRLMTSLRSRSGSGGIQAASRSFFFAIRGYDEDLAWWGAMDGDIVNRARLMGLDLEWIEDRTAMLHQWHPRKHAVLSRPEQIVQARQAWRANHLLVKARRLVLRRNPRTWGGQADEAVLW